jgi:hypothetical protein
LAALLHTWLVACVCVLYVGKENFKTKTQLLAQIRQRGVVWLLSDMRRPLTPLATHATKAELNIKIVGNSQAKIFLNLFFSIVM